MTRKYAIVINESDEKLIVPIRWIDHDKKHYMYPVWDSNYDIKQAVIADEEASEEGYVQKPLKTIVKFCQDYNSAVEYKRINDLENVTDASDPEALKKSRKRRNQKGLPSDFVGPKKRRVNIEQVDCEGDSDESNHRSEESIIDDPLAADQTAPVNVQKVPPELNIYSSSSKISERDGANKTGASEIDSEENDRMSEIGTAALKTSELQKIYDMQKLILQKLNNIDSKLESSEKRSKKNQRKEKFSDSNILSKEIMNLLSDYFPIDANENNVHKKIIEVETKLLNKKFTKVVVRHLRGAGGVNAHDLIYNMIPRVITDEVLQNYSFYGRKSKGVEKNKCFSELSICNCIYTAAKLTFPNVTDDEIKKSLSAFLDQAGTRFKRSQSKSTRKSEPFKPLQLDDDTDDDDLDIQ